MSISTYSELQTAIASWIKRADMAALIPDFIDIAEARLNNDLALSQMEQFSALTASTASRFLALPTRYNSCISLTLTVSSQQIKLTPLPASKLTQIVTSSSGQPRYYAIGAQIQFDCVPDQAYAMTMHNIKSLSIATDLTNFLLTSDPDCYLNPSMASAYARIGNEKALERYEALTRASIDRVKKNDGANRSIAQMTSDVSTAFRGRSNIITG